MSSSGRWTGCSASSNKREYLCKDSRLAAGEFLLLTPDRNQKTTTTSRR